MRKSWEQKEQVINSYSERIDRSSLVIFFDFTGIDAQAITRLRADVKEAEGEVLVGKNTLFYRAFMNTVMADHREVLTGPTALAFAYGDPVRVAKMLYDFVKEIDKEKPLSKIKGAYMQGKFLKPADVQALAELP
ncbi:MAG: 50S ribosomal protein L10, partial [Aquificota bacterium]